MISLLLALAIPHVLAGVIAMSTWLPLMDSFPNVCLNRKNN